MAWGIFTNRSPIHVAPVMSDDEQSKDYAKLAPPHVLDAAGTCQCHPEWRDDDQMWVHNPIN